MTALRIWFGSILLCAALGVSLPCTAAPSPTDGTVRVGDMAPDFTLQSLDGEPLRLWDRVGKKPVLIIFWSYFCFPCQKELPEVDALYRALGPAQVQVIGVSLDGPQYDARVLPYLRDKGITFPNAYDRETPEFFEVAELYGVTGTPTSFLVDLQGRIRFIHLGRLDPGVVAGLLKDVGDQSFCPEITKPSGRAAR